MFCSMHQGSSLCLGDELAFTAPVSATPVSGFHGNPHGFISEPLERTRETHSNRRLKTDIRDFLGVFFLLEKEMIRWRERKPLDKTYRAVLAVSFCFR